jgi:hypothetical protein
LIVRSRIQIFVTTIAVSIGAKSIFLTAAGITKIRRITDQTFVTKIAFSIEATWLILAAAIQTFIFTDQTVVTAAAVSIGATLLPLAAAVTTTSPRTKSPPEPSSSSPLAQQSRPTLPQRLQKLESASQTNLCRNYCYYLHCRNIPPPCCRMIHMLKK